MFFGGVQSSGQQGLVASSETWTWDGATWSLLHPVNSPPPRFSPGLVYDPVHQVLVLYGGSGNSSGGFLNDTWTWDGTNWKQMSPAESPPKWFNAPMTYDATRHAVLLYVGIGDWPIDHPNQTWSWDGTKWTQLPTASNPNTNSGVSPNGTIVYDSTTAQTLYVGQSGTWLLDGASWRRLTGGGTGGPDYAVVDDAARGVLVEVGTNGDTWTWDGTGWTAQNPAVAPPARSDAAIAYDPVRQQVVFFGGFSGSPYAPSSALTDTWAWDGKTWKKVA